MITAGSHQGLQASCVGTLLVLELFYVQSKLYKHVSDTCVIDWVVYSDASQISCAVHGWEMLP